MLPIRLELKNFLAYRSPDPLQFDGIHLACLTGPNGAGKSSLLDAMTWALWGRARGKRDDELVHLGQSDMYVQLDFEQEGMTYRVIRRRSRKAGGTGTLYLYVRDGSQFRDITEPSMRATQARINLLLRLDYETFIHSAFLQQGKADSFTTKAPAQRKQILSDILGLSRWEAYEEAVKARLNEIVKQIDMDTMNIAQIDNELAKEPRLRAVVKEAETAQLEAQQALEGAEKRLAEVAHAPAALRSAQERLADRQQRQKERERDLQSIITEIERQEHRIAGFERVVARRQETEAGYAALQAAREADHDLADKLRLLTDFDARRHELERQLDAARAELVNESSGYEAEIAGLQRIIAQAQPDELAAVQAEMIELEQAERRREEVQTQWVGLKSEQANAEATNKSLRAEMKVLKDRQERLAAAEGTVCPLCGQPLGASHRAQLIEQLQAEGTERGDTFRANRALVEHIDAEVSDCEQTINDLTARLRRFSQLKEQAGVLQAGMDAANDADTRLGNASARLDAVQETLAAEAFGQDIRQQLAALDEQRTALGYDGARHTAAREELETLKEYESRRTQLEIALSSLPDAQAALEAIHVRRERVEAAIAEDENAAAETQVEIAGLKELVKEQQARQQEVNSLRTAERSAYQRLVNAKQELDAVEKQRIRKAELEDRREAKKQEKALYEELRLAFGKNGIPAMIIETAIPELEATANHLLARMTDGRMSLSITTQREKVTGGVAETLDIQIADELGTRSYDLYSGGEAFRINFAIRVALSQLLARRAGAHLQTLFLDEGFGTQDDEGRGKLVEAITAIQDDFDMILVITHIDELRDSFPVHIIVQKTPEGSRITLR